MTDDRFDEGESFGRTAELDRCVKIVKQVMFLEEKIRPEDTNTLNKLHAIIGIMECGE